MAITIDSYPDTYAPVYNPVDFNIHSTNYAQTNFKFVCDIYINSASAMTARLTFPAYPSQNYGYIDIGGVLKNYLTSNIYDYTDTAFHKNGNSILRYDVQWGEQYGASSGVTTYNNLATSTGYAFNGSLEMQNLSPAQTISDWYNWTSSNYTYLNTIKFMTNAPRTGINIRTTESYSLYFFNTGTNYAYDAIVVYYSAAGVQLSSQTITNSYATVGLYDTRYLRLACGPYNLSSFNASCAYYIVYLRDNTTAVTSEGFRFNIDSSCSKAEKNYRLIFLNRMGGFDSFTFMGQNKRTSETQSKTYKTRGGYWFGSLYSFSNTVPAEKVYSTVGTDTFRCQSGWITEDESQWLADLVDSPEVYYHDVSGQTITSVVLTNKNHEYKSHSRDGLFNLEIEFRPTFNKVRQQF